MYHIKPLPDGVDQRSSWQVTRDGTRVSTHTRKTAAESEARRRASNGDRIRYHRTDGTIQRTVTYRGGDGQTAQSQSASGAGPGYGVPTFETGISDAFGGSDEPF